MCRWYLVYGSGRVGGRQISFFTKSPSRSPRRAFLRSNVGMITTHLLRYLVSRIAELFVETRTPCICMVLIPSWSGCETPYTASLLCHSHGLVCTCMTPVRPQMLRILDYVLYAWAHDIRRVSDALHLHGSDSVLVWVKKHTALRCLVS